MDKNRIKNGNTERSLKYIVIYTKKDGSKGRTTYTGKKIDKFCDDLEKSGNSDVMAIPDVKIKE